MRASVAAGWSKALAYVHQNKLVHGDLNPTNILLDQIGLGYIPVLTDFSNSRSVNSRDMVRVIESESIAYAAPEVLLSFGSDAEPIQRPSAQLMKAGDIYSVAMILFEMLNRRLWIAQSSEAVIEEKIGAGFDF